MIGLKIFKIAFLAYNLLKFFSRRSFTPAPLAVIVAIQCEIVLLKSLIMLTPFGN